MYLQHFGLKREPFSIAPDPHFLYMSERHREALAHLLYGVGGGGGFVLLTGEIGAGKTTVFRCLMEQLPKRCNVAYIYNPKLTVLELLEAVCGEFHVPLPEGERRSVKGYVDGLNDYLLRTHAVGQNNVLIIDEAQNLSIEVLEQLRLLTNLETTLRKLLQIVLIGQPELRDMLARPELEQLAQRVVARYHLTALTKDETQHYIAHRLAVAGHTGLLPFDRNARERIFELSRGIPRRINLLCDRALLGAYAGGLRRASAEVVDKAAIEVLGPENVPAARRPGVAPRVWWAMGVTAGVMVAGVALWAWPRSEAGRPTVALPRTEVASAPAAASVPLAPAPAGSAVAVVTPASTATAIPASAPTVALPALPAAAASVTAPASHPASAATAPAASGAAMAVVAALPASAAATAPAASSTLAPNPAAARNGVLAWQELARLWDATLPGGDPCRAAPTVQLQCFRSSATTWDGVRQLGRPALLLLRDRSPRPVYALLTAMGPDSATVVIGGSEQTVTRAALAQTWRGEYATLWRAPPGYVREVASGNMAPIAPWLLAQLRALPGATAAVAGQAADAELKARVSGFQQQQNVAADGLAGPHTLMLLNPKIGVLEPRLKALP